jgi:hypothetical protein
MRPQNDVLLYTAKKQLDNAGVTVTNAAFVNILGRKGGRCRRQVIYRSNQR